MEDSFCPRAEWQIFRGTFAPVVGCFLWSGDFLLLFMMADVWLSVQWLCVLDLSHGYTRNKTVCAVALCARFKPWLHTK